MTEPGDTPDAPRDTGLPDAVERDPAALNAAEDLDEDRMRMDPLEAGMDPPEHWTGVTKYGMTPHEEATPRPLTDRLAEEVPDVGLEPPVSAGEGGPDERDALDDENAPPADGVEEVLDENLTLGIASTFDQEVAREAMERGQLSDEAGGSVPSAVRQPGSA
ncbi:hypothetical protein [Umezawaea beigongshangensis]|uniref:hypothetical protein n=1 Tax=Umezawaea beigongshangensis TaxID=2780383 RepID=UPI0018F124E9|nr:hypothetical protein [Umezawaea beigongshangensis]